MNKVNSTDLFVSDTGWFNILKNNVTTQSYFLDVQVLLIGSKTKKSVAFIDVMSDFNATFNVVIAQIKGKLSRYKIT